MQFVFVGFSSWRLCVQLPITETKSYLSKGMSYSYDNYVNHHYHYHYHYSIHILIYNHVFYRTIIHTSSKTNSRFYSTPLRSLLPIFLSLRPIFELFLMQWPQYWFLILDTVSPCYVYFGFTNRVIYWRAIKWWKIVLLRCPLDSLSAISKKKKKITFYGIHEKAAIFQGQHLIFPAAILFCFLHWSINPSSFNYADGFLDISLRHR